MLEMLAASVVQAVAASAADGVGAMPERRVADRTQRRTAYAALQHSVVRAQLRVGTLLAVHSAQYNVANVPAWVTGYPLVIGILNQVTDDLAQVVTDWRELRLWAPPEVLKAAERLVLALCGLLNSVDPGWTQPRVRKEHRKASGVATAEFLAASADFDTAARADAAPRRRDRRAALSTLRELTAS